MNNSGKTDTSPEVPRWRRMLWPVLALIIVIVVGVYIASPVISILFYMAAPPTPPLPGAVRLVTHENIDHGVDEWLYGADMEICSLVSFYQETGATCEVASRWCGQLPNPNVAPWRDGTLVATCTQDEEFSIFAMRWNAEITVGYPTGEQIRLDLFREISWGGSLPPREVAEP